MPGINDPNNPPNPSNPQNPNSGIIGQSDVNLNAPIQQLGQLSAEFVKLQLSIKDLEYLQTATKQVTELAKQLKEQGKNTQQISDVLKVQFPNQLAYIKSVDKMNGKLIESTDSIDKYTEAITRNKNQGLSQLLKTPPKDILKDPGAFISSLSKISAVAIGAELGFKALEYTLKSIPYFVQAWGNSLESSIPALQQSGYLMSHIFSTSNDEVGKAVDSFSKLSDSLTHLGLSAEQKAQVTTQGSYALPKGIGVDQLTKYIEKSVALSQNIANLPPEKGLAVETTAFRTSGKTQSQVEKSFQEFNKSLDQAVDNTADMNDAFAQVYLTARFMGVSLDNAGKVALQFKDSINTGLLTPQQVAQQTGDLAHTPIGEANKLIALALSLGVKSTLVDEARAEKNPIKRADILANPEKIGDLTNLIKNVFTAENIKLTGKAQSVGGVDISEGMFPYFSKLLQEGPLNQLRYPQEQIDNLKARQKELIAAKKLASTDETYETGSKARALAVAPISQRIENMKADITNFVTQKSTSAGKETRHPSDKLEFFKENYENAKNDNGYDDLKTLLRGIHEVLTGTQSITKDVHGVLKQNNNVPKGSGKKLPLAQ